VTKPEDVIGRSVRFPIASNEVVTTLKIAADGVGPGLEPIIEEGMRAMSVPIKTHESAAGFIKPGSKVDVVMISRGNGEGGRAKTILQNVRVIAVNHSISQNPDESQKGTVIEMITFLLAPSEAEALALAQNTGSLQIVLRNPMEHEFVKTQGVNQDELMKGSSVFSDAKKGPADAPKADPGPNALSDLLTKLLQNKANKEQESADVKDPPIAQVAPLPPDKKKRLIYRDLQGNVLMEVLLDADDRVVESLEGMLEDVEEEAEAIVSSRFMQNPPAVPRGAAPQTDVPPLNIPSSMRGKNQAGSPNADGS
jgi:Flp pilus assembly protein CpaB